jgi:hypothetical protein
VQNGPLGMSEQGQIRVAWKKEPLGFPTGLARDHHTPRVIITHEFPLFKARSSFEPATISRVFLLFLHLKLSIFPIFESFGPMASSSGNSDSLVIFRFHDFRVERMRHWWTLLGEDDHADIVGLFGQFPSLMRLQVDHGLLEALASFWDPTHCCFSIGEVDLVPTLEEYAGLLQLGSPFSETPVIIHSESSVEPSLGEVLGFDFRSLVLLDHSPGRDLAESQYFLGSVGEILLSE